jgi:hypothetical protein
VIVVLLVRILMPRGAERDSGRDVVGELAAVG